MGGTGNAHLLLQGLKNTSFFRPGEQSPPPEYAPDWRNVTGPYPTHAPYM